MKNVVIDTGFWFALFDSSDEHHKEALDIYELIKDNNIIIPFPTLYETINTAFSKQSLWMQKFQEIVNQPNITKLFDEQYRDDALGITFYSSLKQKRNLSLVDVIIRLILDDDTVSINYLVTFNVGDFNDVCNRRNIEILQD
ncbi:MAG TPA: PIN domain-containing protein [Ignavibacteria bacterium]